MTVKRKVKIGFWGIVILSFLIIGLFYPWVTQWPYGWSDDDGYFYTQIAYNIATKGVSTFDGVHITDGYHLLWAGILAGESFLVSLVTLDKGWQMYFFMVLSMFFVFYIPWRFGRNWPERIIYFGLAYMGKLLMETHLLAILYLELVDRSINHKDTQGWRRFLSYAIVILIPLTRIDASVMVAGFSCYYLMKKDFRIFGAMNAALMIGMALHFILNHSIEGSWFSVSALIKGSEASFNTNLLVENLVKGGLGYSLRAAVLFLLAGSSVWLISSRLSQRENRMMMWAFIGTALFSFGHLYFSWLRAWYYVPGHVIFAFLFFRSDPRNENRFRWVKRGTILVLYISIAGYFGVRIDDYLKGKEEAKYVKNFISDIEKYVPEGEMIFQRDGTGYTGYYSKRPIFNGDGLVNNHAYAKLVIDKRLDDYMDQHHIRYLISNFPPTGGVIDDYCGLKIRLQDVDVLLEKKNNGGNRFSNFVLYRKKPVKTSKED